MTLRWKPYDHYPQLENGYGDDGLLVAKLNKQYSQITINGHEYQFDTAENARNAADVYYRTKNPPFATSNHKGTFMLKDIATDLKGFIHDNRNVIYWLAVAFLVDHFFLGGTFRARLHGLVEKMIGKAEQKLGA